MPTALFNYTQKTTHTHTHGKGEGERDVHVSLAHGHTSFCPFCQCGGKCADVSVAVSVSVCIR